MSNVIFVDNVEFKGIYVSVWFEDKFSWYCKRRPSTVYNDAPSYYIPLVFTQMMSNDEILTFVKDKILGRYGVCWAEWEKTIHVKHFYQVESVHGRRYEVWCEFNFNAIDNKWWSNTVSDVKEGDVLICNKGFEYYKLLPFRFVGSLFTMKWFVLWSDDKYQYVAISKGDMRGD